MMATTIDLERRGNLDVIDEKAMLENSDFPIGTDELVRKTKLFIENKYGAEDKSTLDAKFEFIGPFVGPLNRDQYVDALGGALNPEDGFPDLR